MIDEELRLAAEAAKQAEAQEKPEDEEPADDEDQDGEDQDGEKEEKPEPEVVEKPKLRKKYKHLPFSEKDYAMRDPVEEYKIIKEVEDEVLNFKKENVKTYVISAGILYGKGEAIFNSHIQKAWL